MKKGEKVYYSDTISISLKTLTMRRSATRIARTKRLENKIQIFMLRHCYTANIILLSWLLFPRLQNDGFIPLF